MGEAKIRQVAGPALLDRDDVVGRGPVGVSARQVLVDDVAADPAHVLVADYPLAVPFVPVSIASLPRAAAPGALSLPSAALALLALPARMLGELRAPWS